MKEQVLEDFKELMQGMEEKGAADRRVKKDYGIVTWMGDYDRIEQFLLFGNLRFIENLGFKGEGPDFKGEDLWGEHMLLLAHYLIQEEDETWIFDIDALNWTMKFGFWRDVRDLLAQPVLSVRARLEIRKTFQDDGYPVAFLKMALEDWMS